MRRDKDLTTSLWMALAIIIGVILLIVGWFMFGFTTAKSTVDNLIIGPDKNQELIKVTTHISYVSGQIPKQMRVIVEECNGDLGICYSDTQNISMLNRGAGNYQRRNITMLHSDATYINCKIIRLNTDGIWYPCMSERYDII